MTRIAVIGGGSSRNPGLAFAFAGASERLGAATVVLHDVDPVALDLQERLTRGIIRARAAAPLEVEATTDLARALEGADFVLTTFRPGGFPARHLDESIPPKYGIVGNETVGPGGMAMALRSVPVALAIAAATTRLASPNAVILNYTNPVQIVTDALSRYSDVPVIGMCDQFAGEIEYLAGLAGWDPRAMQTDTFGLNHLAWTRAVRLDGRDVTEELWNLLAKTDWTDVADPYWAPVIRMFPLFGMVANNYVKYYVMHDEMLAAQRESGMTRAQQIMAELPDIMASYRAEAEADDPDPSMLRANPEHGDFAVSVIEAALSGRDRRLILNVPNAGAMPELPADAVVEVPCILRGTEPRPMQAGPLPGAVAGLVRQVAHHNRLATDAAVAGDRDLAVRAMVAHPLVNSIGTAERLVDELLAAHAAHLPQFA